MDPGLKGKVAWVTGASSGLGRASALALGGEGAHVAVSARRAGELDEVAGAIESAGGRGMVVPLDVTDAGGIRAAHDAVTRALGPVDILVSNGGGPPPGGFEDFDDDALYGAFTLTTASAWRLAQTVTPDMRQRRTGCLLFLTSGSTKEVIPNLLLSNMMRAAVVAMAKTMSKELGPHGVRVLCVAPGRIETPRLVQLDEAAAQKSGQAVEEMRSSLIDKIPLGRYGEPREFGDVVAWLASERASYLSGISVSVDGGALNGVLS